MKDEGVLSRFLRYVKIDTTSDENSDSQPSAEREWTLSKLLREELIAMGAQNVILSQYGYVYATLPKTAKDALPVLGLVAHVDTSPAASGKDVKPVLHENYNGGDIRLGGGTRLSPADFHELKRYVGQTLITADGSTLLGADDKAGVAEIMTLAAYLLANPQIAHGEIHLAFTPDEEVGRGTEHFETELFPVNYAYTVDGGELGEIEYENFNAATLTLTVNGFSIHPGSAKNKMKNALQLAYEFHGMLPAHQDPVCTEGYEGFYMLHELHGGVEKAEANYIIRDHDRALFDKKKQTVLDIVAYLNQKYGEGTFEADIRDSYYNMKEIVEKHMHLVENAKQAMCMADVEPKVVPIRGGTDGASLSYRGIPCPNLCTGGHNFHGRSEYIPLESMLKTVEILKNIVSLYAQK